MAEDLTERMVLRFYVKHRMRDLMSFGGWSEEQLLDAFEEYVIRRPDSLLSRAAEHFRNDLISWIHARATAQPSAPMPSYRTVETEP